MVRYFFDVREDEFLHIDTEGTELADADAAGAEAIQAMAELALETLPSAMAKHLTMTVRDVENGGLFELDLLFKFAAVA